jgi:hypothetical protein
VRTVPITEPDRAKLLAEEANVTPPINAKDGYARGAYDLRLYEALNAPGYGVLEVGMTVWMQFIPGRSTRPMTRGTPLDWTSRESSAFLIDAKVALERTWSAWHTRQTIVVQGNPGPFPSVVFVQYNLDMRKLPMGEPLGGKHWAVTISKADDHLESRVGRIHNMANFDSFDLTPFRRRDGQNVYAQRGLVHEFGHMQGLRDEYDQKDGDAIPGNPHLADRESIMNWGETVRPRHYTPFAYWLTKILLLRSGLRRLMKKPDDISYKVIDMPNNLLDFNHASL